MAWPVLPRGVEAEDELGKDNDRSLANGLKAKLVVTVGLLLLP